ncbi:nuclear transport factor 2 family protein [Sinimarinibacterium sp. CAU 1509]|uniref:nuclear transport factor 2 family protein n=1 Tax=Sinimarinibacterium sp. CAU 1509 TaxID=2562283 RepID=UPI00146DB45B|nr:nuclear transport factor 2 family protein [Sinimarinibacterium sp. CAU 1509]
MNSSPDSWLPQLFASIDARDAAAFCEFLTEDAVFRYGNADPVSGRDAIRSFVGGFFEAIAGLEHRIERHWSEPDAVICHGTVSYTRHDRSTLTVPFANILKLGDNRVRDYLIFVDASALFAPG